MSPRVRDPMHSALSNAPLVHTLQSLCPLVDPPPSEGPRALLVILVHQTPVHQHPPLVAFAGASTAAQSSAPSNSCIPCVPSEASLLLITWPAFSHKRSVSCS